VNRYTLLINVSFESPSYDLILILGARARQLVTVELDFCLVNASLQMDVTFMAIVI
jgi:hypothetical protein